MWTAALLLVVGGLLARACMHKNIPADGNYYLTTFCDKKTACGTSCGKCVTPDDNPENLSLLTWLSPPQMRLLVRGRFSTIRMWSYHYMQREGKKRRESEGHRRRAGATLLLTFFCRCLGPHRSVRFRAQACWVEDAVHKPVCHVSCCGCEAAESEWGTLMD